jgi:glutathione synthase/RimK-type ligase-like ATP-grasp enzyme
MILIITSEFDPHADSVIYALKELGENEFIRIDLETAHFNFDFGINIENGKPVYWYIHSKSNKKLYVNSESLSAVWWRRSTAFYKTDHLTLPTIDTIDNIETYWMLRYLFENLNTSYFTLGHPIQMRVAENKIKQLIAANECGFLIPNTVITNHSNDLNNLLKNQEKIIIKPFKSSIVVDNETLEEISLKTSINNTVILKEKICSNKTFSLFSQHAINKIADIRVTVLNKKVISCRIDTSPLPENEVDWRPYTFDYNHSIFNLPKSIEKKIYEFMNLMNIRSGYFDFGLDSENNYWFIECNPNAQWLWIELKTGYKISLEIAKQLIETKKSND